MDKVSVAISQRLAQRLQQLVAQRLKSTTSDDTLYFPTLDECCEHLLDDVLDIYVDEYIPTDEVK